MKYLTMEQICSKCNNYGNGRIIRIGYSKELGMLKKFADQGFRAYKLTETSVRLGVAYGNIKAVIARKAEEGDKPKVERANNYEWIIRNKVKLNSNTGKSYLQVATLNKGHNTKSQYMVYNPETQEWIIMTKAEWEESEYFAMADAKSRKSSDSRPDIYTITIGNIYKLGDLMA